MAMSGSFVSRTAALVLCAALLAGCATRFVATETNPLRPRPTPAWEPGELTPTTTRLLSARQATRAGLSDPVRTIAALEPLAAKDLTARAALIEVAISAGMKAHRRFMSDRGAAGFYLCAAEHAFEARGKGSAEFQRLCREALRYSVARLAELREVAVKNGIKVAPLVKGPTRSYRIVIRRDAPGAVDVHRYSTVLPTDRFRVVGARELALVEGAGTPLVGKVKGLNGAAAAKAMTVSDGTWLPLTATLEFGRPAAERTATFTLYDRNRVEMVVLGGRKEPLAADFSTPFAVRTRELNQENFITLGFLGFFRGDRLFEDTGLYPLEFPTTDKIPVVLVHGLISEPNDWRFLHNRLLADPEIRQRYQFWAFYYPTSLPVPWSATRLRQALANAQKQLNPRNDKPALKRMVLVGHSMGGLLSRLQIVGGGEVMYSRYFRKPPEKLRLDAEERTMIRDMFFFRPNENVEEVVFICVPHQGSFLATNWIGRISRTLARLPLTIIETTANIVTLNSDALTVDSRFQPGTSIDSLSPGGEFASMLQELPMSERVKKFSIIGDRGRGGDVWHSSDGVVPYWSSHIEGVPEVVIPSDHSGPEHPLAAEKLKEWLKRTSKR